MCVEAEALYVTCKLQNCTDSNKGKPFPGYIDPNSLVVQDEYVFVQVGNCPVRSVKSIKAVCDAQSVRILLEFFFKVILRKVPLVQFYIPVVVRNALLVFFFMCLQIVFTQRFHHLKVSTAGRPIYYVSAKRDVFTPMKLPKYTLPKVTSILSN